MAVILPKEAIDQIKTTVLYLITVTSVIGVAVQENLLAEKFMNTPPGTQQVIESNVFHLIAYNCAQYFVIQSYSALFWTPKGAFTGRIMAQWAISEKADGGILF